MALFQQQLQTEVISEQAVQEPSTIGAISNLAGAFLKAQPSPSTKGAPNYEQSLIANFSTTIENLKQARESGELDEVTISRLAQQARADVGKLRNDRVPEVAQQTWENFTGIEFGAGLGTNEEYQKAQLLEGAFAIGIRPSVVSELEANGIDATDDVVNNAVLAKVEKKNKMKLLCKKKEVTMNKVYL